jgi:hypothetical protein
MQERAITIADVRIGEALRDEGIRAAAEHANAVTPLWTDLAYAVLLEYGPKLGTFTPFDIRACGIARSVPPPPDARAWGSVFKRAASAKKIRFLNYVPHPDPRCHRCPTKSYAWIG